MRDAVDAVEGLEVVDGREVFRVREAQGELIGHVHPVAVGVHGGELALGPDLEPHHLVALVVGRFLLGLRGLGPLLHLLFGVARRVARLLDLLEEARPLLAADGRVGRHVGVAAEGEVVEGVVLGLVEVEAGREHVGHSGWLLGGNKKIGRHPVQFYEASYAPYFKK